MKTSEIVASMAEIHVRLDDEEIRRACQILRENGEKVNRTNVSRLLREAAKWGISKLVVDDVSTPEK